MPGLLKKPALQSRTDVVDLMAQMELATSSDQAVIPNSATLNIVCAVSDSAAFIPLLGDFSVPADKRCPIATITAKRELGHDVNH